MGYRILSFLVFFAFCGAAQADWKENSRSTQQSQLLKKIESQVVQTKNPVLVFDLDSTLFKNYGRWIQIIQEFGEQENLASLKSCQKKQITDSWDMMNILAKDCGLGAQKAKEVIGKFKGFWATRFFNDDYVKYDEALPGAKEYVNEMYKKGAHVVYITGRDAPNMRKGTVAKLKADGFPIGMAKTELIMKPFSNTDLRKKAKTREEYEKLIDKTDKEFKSQALKKAQKYGTVVASFDNDPTHINLYYNAFHKQGQGWAVFLNTDHTKNAPAVEKGVHSVHGFLK